MSKYDDYLSGPTPEGYRNDETRDAITSGFRQGKPIEPVIERALENGLKVREVQKIVNSCQRYREREDVSPKDGMAWRRIAHDDTITLEGDITCGLPSPHPEWNRRDRVEFIRAVFKPGDYISVVRDPKRMGGSTWTYEQLIAEDMDLAWTPTGNEGTWVRINAMKRDGTSDADVERYDYALIEADNIPLESQWHALVNSNLPIVTVTHSGGRSLHALVRVNAKDRAEYDQRVHDMHAFLLQSGFGVDTTVKNPSRLSRLPGVMRGESPQYLVGTSMGAESYEAWRDWARVPEEDEEEDHGLGPFDCWRDYKNEDLPLAPELIHGILRRGHRGMLAGPSKSGKSFAMIALAAAVASGGKWFGHQCTEGCVLYVNMEIDRGSLQRRIKAVDEHIKITKKRNLLTWTLKRKLDPDDPLRHLARGLRWALKRIDHAIDLIVLDPIYKIQTGDENTARDINRFLSELDQITRRCGDPAVFFCHHFAKGNSALKAAIDRASGSGVWARDPDAIGTLTALKGDVGYEMEWSLREFACPPKTQWAFTYPVHEPISTSVGLAGAAGRPTKKGADLITIQFRLQEGPKRIKDLAKELDVCEKTIKNRIKTAPTIFVWDKDTGTVGLAGDSQPVDTNKDDPTDGGMSRN